IFHMALVFFIWRSYFSYGARIFHMALVFHTRAPTTPFFASLSTSKKPLAKEIIPSKRLSNV
ncbi:hypothetical protein, partial [Fictibacillus phosphorivorans]|uniref:hypothetical protein n=1 Tax=Fictibacillus phosphorivorans TaxID=1221500 RepID=UPI001C92D796